MGNYFDQFDAPKSEGNYFDQFDAAPNPLAAVGNAAGTAYDYARTQGNKMLGGIVGLPRAAMEGVNWLGQMDKQYGGTGAQVPDSVKNFFPTGPEVTAQMNKPPPPISAIYSKDAFNKYMATKDVPRPEVNLEGNMPGGAVADAAIQGAMSLPFTGGTSLPSILASIGGPTLSEAGGQIAHEYAPQYETPIRLGLGAVGAGTGALTGAVINKGINVGKAAVAPFTQAGSDRLVGTALRDAASNPTAAINGLDKFTVGQQAFPNAVPGFQLNAGKASMDPGLMAAADTMPDRLRGSVMQSNNGILTGALDKAAAGLPPASEAGRTIQDALGAQFNALRTARKNAAGPLYTAARANPQDLVIGPLFQHIDDAISSTKGATQTTLQGVRKLLFDNQGRPDWSPAGAMAARTEVNALLESPSLDSNLKRLLTGMKGKLETSLGSVPEEAAARSTYAQMSKPLEPFSPDFGNKNVSDVVAKAPYGGGYLMPADKVVSQFVKAGDLSGPAVDKVLMAAGNDPAVKQALASHYMQDFRDSVGHGVQVDGPGQGNAMLNAAPAAKWLDQHSAGASKVLTPDQMNALKEISGSLSAQAQAVPGRVGSPTFDRLATNSILGELVGPKLGNAPFMHSINKVLGFAYGGANEAAMNKLYGALADPAVASALMKKATPGNAKMAEPVLRAIGRGSVVPTLQGISQ